MMSCLILVDPISSLIISSQYNVALMNFVDINFCTLVFSTFRLNYILPGQ